MGLDGVSFTNESSTDFDLRGTTGLLAIID